MFNGSKNYGSFCLVRKIFFLVREKYFSNAPAKKRTFRTIDIIMLKKVFTLHEYGINDCFTAYLMSGVLKATLHNTSSLFTILQ